MNETTDAAAIFAPLWKRKWLILIVGLLVAGGSYYYFSKQNKVFAAATQVYLGGGNEVQSLISNTQASTVGNDRTLANQAQLINSNIVGDAVIRRLVKQHRLLAAAGSATAAAATGSDFIQISARARTGRAAADLANAYAQVFLHQRLVTRQHQIQTALSSTRQQLHSAEQQGSPVATQTLQIQDLVDRINQLHSQLLVGSTGDQQIDPAVASATPLSPRPVRNAIFGFVLGMVLAAVAAYALSRFDRRLRSLADIEAVFQVPLLTALPSIRRPVINVKGEPLPAQSLREPLRRLHTTLQLRGMLDESGSPGHRSILFVSASAGDGKSTLVANLALAQRAAGDRVAIIESDFRRPVQAKLLGVDGSQGLAEVLAGELPVGEAMQKIESPALPEPNGSDAPAPGVAAAAAAGMSASGAPATAVKVRNAGSVSVLAGGGSVVRPPAQLSGQAMPAVLRAVAQDFDYVLIDAPPPLAVSDVLPLLSMADAIVVVARIGHTSEAAAERLVELLRRSSSVPVIGVVANDVPSSEIEAFGLSSGYYEHNWPRS
ncbi:MAG TPA: Wzz/FepE/Etk N-terminal domain-containing protein [Solirubrobacteraceae bacterium]|nr:Wzz/FepE/Etk N-terminal domain-containing protein [Solirubrobacteraceae bacterium]